MISLSHTTSNQRTGVSRVSGSSQRNQSNRGLKVKNFRSDVTDVVQHQVGRLWTWCFLLESHDLLLFLTDTAFIYRSEKERD